MKVKFIHDKYKTARGGRSHLLDISCEKCGTHVFYYQKDGPGFLKRMYFDRIIGSKEYENLQNKKVKEYPKLTCVKCKNLMGIPYVYEKENRLAFKLFVGETHKKVVSSR